MLNQAVGHKIRRYEISGCPQLLQQGGCLAADSRDAQAAGASGQALPETLQPFFHSPHTVGAGEQQPMELIQFVEGIVQGPPLIRRADHQGWQIDHLGAQLFQLPAPFPLLLLGPRHQHRAAFEGEHQAPTSSSFTMPCTWL